jgi:hypothetical protein
MCGFIFFKEPFGLLWVPMEAAKLERYVFKCSKTHRKSPSLDVTNTHVSSSRRPNLEPTGSVSMTCCIADPTRPEPPVTRMTDWVCLIDSDMTGKNVERGEVESAFYRVCHDDLPLKLHGRWVQRVVRVSLDLASKQAALAYSEFPLRSISPYWNSRFMNPYSFPTASQAQYVQ